MADGEKMWQQETVARDSKDGGVATMAAEAEEGSGRQGRQRQMTMVADEDGSRQ
jgi:hypothetical protein